ncbi:terminase small subunit [Hymenobacter tenuis]
MAKKSTEVSPVDNLTPQRRKFAEAYVLSFNGTKAAQAAGYSEKTARQQASRLLTSVDIQAAIKHLLKECISPEEIAARWQRIATASLDDFYSKVRVEHTPRIEKRLADIVAKARADIEFEQELAIRSEEFITKEKDRVKFRKEEARKHQRREMQLLRLELELEKDPNGVRIVDGPTEWKYEMQLDLAKAEALGMLDLVKTHNDGKNGTSFSLRDQDGALGKLAVWRGMLTNKVDLTSKGESITPQYDPAELAKKLSPEQLAVMRSAHEALQNG